MRSHRFFILACYVFASFLAVTPIVDGQGTPDQATTQWHISVSRSVCNELTGCTECTASTGSTCSVSFNVPSNGNYNLYANVIAPAGGNCGHCQACVKLYQGATVLREIATPCGGVGSCASEIDGITLSTANSYKLCVCLIPCPSETHICSTCSQGYTATGCLTATFGGGGCN